MKIDGVTIPAGWTPTGDGGTKVAAADIEAAADIPLSKLVDAVCSKTEADTKIAAVTGLNKVKLPAPSESDYITPSAVAVSSEGESLDLSALELRVHASPPANIPNIYDEDDGTYSHYGILPGSATREAVAWDLGSIASREVTYKISTSNASARNHLYYSLNDSDWTLIITACNNTKTGTVVEIFRYLKWEAQNASSEPLTGNWRLHTLGITLYIKANLIDDETTTQWRPNPTNEVNAWCRGDMGALKICSGCRIYWGADANYRPTAYRIEVSEDASTWTTVVTETTAPDASAWKEYSWNARYARYIRMIVDTHGANGTEVFEIDYYSRILERVASEHGHGSGVTKHLKVKHSKGHPVMIRGETLRSKVKDLPSMIEWLDFVLKD